MASAFPPPGPDGVPKHRACDECRSRKLACSKEPEGCSRCRKEAIPCHYSPQKPMGRPRKRRHVEQDAPQPLHQDFVRHGMTPGGLGAVGPSQPPMVLDDFQMHPPSLVAAVDQDHLSFLDEASPPNMEFWDLLPGNYMEMPTDPNLFLSAAAAAATAAETESAAAGPAPPTTVVPPLNLSGVDLLGSIDFDEPDHSAAVSRDLSASLQRYMAEHVSLPQGTSTSTPVDSILGSDHGTSVGGSPEDSTSTATPPTPPPPPSMRAVPTISCSCLSSLFLALDSLSRLPPEVILAMRVARNASKVAHDVINCPSCSAPLLDDPGTTPPIQCFQNLMFLGTLVPSACNAYATILEMVDAETASAKKQGRTFWFSFRELGGLWGKVGESADCCSSIRNYNNSSMAPDLWRATIRGLLRLDVYGMGELDDGIHTTGPYTQIGLRDVVRLLEERTRKRHEMLDSFIASGQSAKALPVGIIYPSKPCTPEERNCVRILETARVALDNLVIA